MIPSSALKKKATSGADVFRKTEKDRNGSKSGSSTHSTKGTTGSPSSHSSRNKMPNNNNNAGGTVRGQGNLPLANAPVVLDLHRFADDTMKPEECKLLNKTLHTYIYIYIIHVVQQR